MKLTKLPLGSIVAQGYLAKELSIMKKGLTGVLPNIWDDVSSRSAWLGGDGESWERGPYYLTGLISLAWTLKDDDLKKEGKKWVESILASQREDGFFGPIRTKDWWSRTVVVNAFCSYHEATKDERILQFLRKYFAYQTKELDNYPLYMWASARGEEEFYALNYYYKLTGDLSVFGLAKKIKELSYGREEIFGDFKFKKPVGRYVCRPIINIGRWLGAKKDREQKYGNTPIKELSAEKIVFRNKALKNLMLTHGVNVAMALKYPVYSGIFAKNQGAEEAKRAYFDLMKYHGTCLGIFTADEQLNGTGSTQGIELCSVVELAYTTEKLIEMTGESMWGDVLELMIFNALPATITDDFTAHQYVQQPNQISATLAKRRFFDVGREGNIFGLEPNYGCCTANMHQGFPRFVEHLCYKSEKGFAFYTYGSCLIYTEQEGKRLRFRMDTNYPFEDEIRLTVEDLDTTVPVEFCFRIPFDSDMKAFYNGKPVGENKEGFIRTTQHLMRGDTIVLKITSPLKVVKNPDNSISFRRGNLIFVPELPLGEKKIKGEEPFHDREYTTDAHWKDIPVVEKNTAVVLDVIRKKVDRDLPFGRRNAPIKYVCESVVVTNWEEKGGNASKYPKKPIFAKDGSIVTLIPYGFSKLRMAQLPLIPRPHRDFMSAEAIGLMDEMEKSENKSYSSDE